MNTKNIIVGAIIVVALLLGGLAFAKNSSSSAAVALFGNVAGGTVSPTGVILPNPTVFDFVENRIALLADKQFMLGGATVSTGIDQVASIGSCAGSATSTQFAVKNPFAATSTAKVLIENGQNSASSTVFKVGTSTTAFPNATASNLSTTLINATIASSSAFAYSSGDILASAGAGTQGTITVGPSEWVDAYATSTYSTGIQVGVPSCVYKLKWEI